MMSQEKKPMNKFQDFMANFGSNALGSLVSGLLLIGATALLANIHFLNFNWLILMILFQNIVIALFVGYCFRTRRKLLAKQQIDATAVREDFFAFQDATNKRVNQEIKRWNESATTYSQANAKEQAERLQDAKNEVKKVIAEAKAELTEAIHNDYMSWNKWTYDHAGAHERQKTEQNERLEEVKKQLDESIEDVSKALGTAPLTGEGT